MLLKLTSFLLLCFVCAVPLAAQTPPVAAAPTPGAAGFKSNQWNLEQVSATHWRLTGQVDMEFGQARFFADEVDYYTDKNLVIAKGNVVFANPEGRISAEHIEFDTRTRTGTFYQASGILSLGAKADRTQFGNQDPDVFFYGETVTKLGDKKYRITHGGFTTCVQPTPRWEMSSGSLVLNLDDYAIARNTVLRVKGVPMMYLPIIYYPIQEDERATGFLMPTYGTSTFRGQSISNAFFWAINRSNDATFFHDWFTRTGQGFGTEYRYVAGQQSSGEFKVYRFNQKQAEFTSGGSTNVLPPARSLDVTGEALQYVAPGVRARSRVDYFSNIVSQQLYQQNIYQASQRRRIISAGLTGNWGPYATTFSYDQNEIFNDAQNSFVYGSTPRMNVAVAPRRLYGLPIYGAVNGEFANLPYRYELNGVTQSDSDRGMTRLDMSPFVRVPVSRWTFLTLNTSAAYRFTRYSESLDARGIQVPVPFTRSFWDLKTDAIGPVFTKIWDAAATSRAERFKHVIEPTFGFHQVTGIQNYRSTPLLSSTSEFVVGGTTSFSYGLTNRFLRRNRPMEGVLGGAQEFLVVSVQQSYYSDKEASQYDTNYSSSLQGRKPVDLSPIAVITRYAPTAQTNVTGRLEYDVSGAGLQSVSASSSIGIGGQSASVSLSRSRIFETLPAQTYLSAYTTLSFLQGRVRGNHSLSWDISRSTIVSQAMSGTYYAQCCGFAVEFQTFNYPQISSIPIPSDRRMNFSFTLAGLGTFSNFFGAFGGQR